VKPILDRLSLGDLLRWFFPGYLLIVSYYFSATDHFGLPTPLLEKQHLYVLPALLIGLISSAVYRAVYDQNVENRSIRNAKDYFVSAETESAKLFFEYHKQIWCADKKLSKALERFVVWSDVNYFLLTSAFTIAAGVVISLARHVCHCNESMNCCHVILLICTSAGLYYAGQVNSDRATIAKQVVINKMKSDRNDETKSGGDDKKK
jgi:hypothetical protein